MRDNSKNDTHAKQLSSPWKQSALPAAILAVMQACLTIRGMGIEGFVLWAIIILVAYWLLFTFLIWGWRRLRDRT